MKFAKHSADHNLPPGGVWSCCSGRGILACLILSAVLLQILAYSRSNDHREYKSAASVNKIQIFSAFILTKINKFFPSWFSSVATKVSQN